MWQQMDKTQGKIMGKNLSQAPHVGKKSESFIARADCKLRPQPRMTFITDLPASTSLMLEL